MKHLKYAILPTYLSLWWHVTHGLFLLRLRLPIQSTIHSAAHGPSSRWRLGRWRGRARGMRCRFEFSRFLPRARGPKINAALKFIDARSNHALVRGYQGNGRLPMKIKDGTSYIQGESARVFPAVAAPKSSGVRVAFRSGYGTGWAFKNGPATAVRTTFCGGGDKTGWQGGQPSPSHRRARGKVLKGVAFVRRCRLGRGPRSSLRARVPHRRELLMAVLIPD